MEGESEGSIMTESNAHRRRGRCEDGLGFMQDVVVFVAQRRRVWDFWGRRRATGGGHAASQREVVMVL